MVETYTESEQRVIDFASAEGSILGVSRGNDPEEGNKVYYLLTGSDSHFDDGLCDRIANFEIESVDRRKEYIDLMQWPTSLDNVGEEGFLGKVIWMR